MLISKAISSSWISLFATDFQMNWLKITSDYQSLRDSLIFHQSTYKIAFVFLTTVIIQFKKIRYYFIQTPPLLTISSSPFPFFFFLFSPPFCMLYFFKFTSFWNTLGSSVFFPFNKWGISMISSVPKQAMPKTKKCYLVSS